jgi:predicted ABC-type ATPase
MSQIVIISGPPGAGKSTVCEALCQRYDRTVHLTTDDMYGWIRMGYIAPWKPGSMRQNMMVSRSAARAATAFAQEQYGVFVDGVIGPLHLPLYIEEMRVAGVPVHYAVLLPPVEETMRRARVRAETDGHARAQYEQQAQDGKMLARVHAMFADTASLPGWTLDNSDMTAEQTADAVMEACSRGECLVWSPP